MDTGIDVQGEVQNGVSGAPEVKQESGSEVTNEIAPEENKGLGDNPAISGEATTDNQLADQTTTATASGAKTTASGSSYYAGPIKIDDNKKASRISGGFFIFCILIQETTSTCKS